MNNRPKLKINEPVQQKIQTNYYNSNYEWMWPNNVVFHTPTNEGRRLRAQSFFNVNPSVIQNREKLERLIQRLNKAAKGPMVNLTSTHPYNTGRPRRNRPNNKNTIRKNIRNK